MLHLGLFGQDFHAICQVTTLNDASSAEARAQLGHPSHAGMVI